MRAIGYVRQSARRDQELALSPEQQRSEIRRLAARDGYEQVEIIEDLGRSGGKGKEHRRKGYQAIIAAVEADAVDVIYAKALSRLGRSTAELYRFADLCLAHGVRIVTAKEGTLDPRTPTGRLQFGMMALVNEFERDLRVEAALENAASRRARGERMGRAPYGTNPGEDPSKVVRAFERTRSLNAAARALNEALLPSPLGRLWSGTGVRIIVQREAPHLLPRRRTHGVKPSSPFLLFRLLKCRCGKTLTASRDTRRGNGSVLYRCHAASTIPDHGPYRVMEADLLPWIQAEAARLRVPEQVMVAEADATTRTALLARRERYAIAFADGNLSHETYSAKVANIDAELERLDDVEAVIEVPAIDWDWPPEAINRVLACLWSSVELDATMRPIRAEWRLPAEYVR
jgi:DNA invertase Pin-like site-specific DNA recombinase